MSKKMIYLISFVLLLGVAGNASAWFNQDIGSPNLPGSAFYDSATDTWTVVGDGSDIWGPSDQFHYVYCPLCGDGMIEVNLASMDVTDEFAKAGVMIREKLTGDSTHAMMAMTGTNGVQFLWRSTTGGGSACSTTPGEVLPERLRITRVGDELFGAYWAPIVPGMPWLGFTWYEESVAIPMDTCVYIGMAVTSRNSNQLCTAVFDNVTATLDCTAASNPSPPDGAVCVDPNVVLSWSPGCLAESHNVYFGLDPGALTLVAIKPLGDESYDPPGPLEIDTTYYWRIDENCSGGVVPGEVWSFTTGTTTAYNPSPPDGATCVDPNVILSWSPGCCADWHDVYFGADETAVTNATVLSPEFKGRQSRGNETYTPGHLDKCTTYYWRIDEICEDTIVAVPPDPAHLLAYYEFENNADDSSGNGFHGTPIGDATIVADGERGQVLSLDGDGDYVDLGNPAALNFGTGDWTVSMWIKTTESDKGVLFANGGGGAGGIHYALVVGESQNDKITLSVDDDQDRVQAHSSTNVTDGEWHCVAGVRDGDTLRVYVDCELEATAGLPAGYDLSGTVQHNALIGAIWNHGTNTIEKFYTGLIDDLRIYDYALSHEEVRYVCDCRDIPMTETYKGEVWSFTTEDCPCECLSIRVSQESSPGLGDFDENVLGCIKVFETVDSAKDYYAYDTCGDSFGNLDFINQHGLIAARSHLFLVCGCDGLSLFIVHDKPDCAPGPNNPNDGRAEMRFVLLGDPTRARRTVEDDPTALDAYKPALGEWRTTFSSQHEWFVGRTDGEVITGLDGDGWSMLVEFTEYDSNPETPVIEGLNSWFAYSEDGSNIELDLEADRRIRLDCCIPECDILGYRCRADVKWSQPPRQVKKGIINGWDEVSSYDNSPIVADDWLCKDERAIKGIHWWGSFKGWTECVPPEEMPDAFHIGIWTDVPDPDPYDLYTFSHPGELVWEKISDCYVWSFAGYDLDPRGIEPNEACFKFDQLLSQDEWFYQDPNDDDGTVYWLSIAAIYDDGSASCWLVDDFESYTDTPDLLNAWQALGGTSFLFLSKNPNPHHFGDQAMGFTYANYYNPYYSEGAFTPPERDWTAGGVKKLSLWFKGETYNPVEQMYVALEDTLNVAVVKHDDAYAVTTTSWQQWCIDLTNFTGVNLANVDKLYIGFGDRYNPSPADANGTVYFDDIRLCNECPNEPNFPWGWKTRPHFYSDDAVHIATLDGGEWPPAIGSVWESGEPIQYPEGTSWDMAFVLTANRKYRQRKWWWPHTSWTVREELMAVDVYEDGRIDFKDLAVSANYWLEEAVVWP